MARACRENGCALIGGETAEMPGFYADGEYDIAGFIVGVVERTRIVDGRDDRARRRADRPAVGRPAHERLLARAAGAVRRARDSQHDTFVRELGATVGDALLAPHRSYLPLVRPLLERELREGAGAYHRRRHHRESAPRPSGGLRRRDRSTAWTAPPIFRLIQQRGGVSRDEMFRDVQHGHRPDRGVRGGATPSASSTCWPARASRAPCGSASSWPGDRAVRYLDVP